jgi:hypothetical protein
MSDRLKFALVVVAVLAISLLAAWMLYSLGERIEAESSDIFRERVIERCVQDGLLTRKGCELGYELTEPEPKFELDERLAL